MSLKLLLIVIAIAVISADYTSKVDYTCSDCKCVVDNNTTQFTYGEPVGLCVHFIACNTALGSCSRVRSSYALKVDDYAVVELSGGQDKFALASDASQYDTIKIVIQAHGNYTSDPIDFVKFSGTTLNFYANVYSAVISIHNGTVYNITWDNYCGLCEDTDQCKTITLDTTTSRTTQICNSVEKCKDKNNNVQCDPKLYISWIGSDKKNQKMTSAGMRLARFRNFKIDSAYTAAENLINATSSSSSSSTSSTTTPTTVTS